MIDIRVSLERTDSDNPSEIEHLHHRLHTSLNQSGLERVRPVRSEETAPGARGVKEIVLGVFDAVLPEAFTSTVPALARALADFRRRSRSPVYIEVGDSKLLIGEAQPEEIEKIVLHFFTESTGKGR